MNDTNTRTPQPGDVWADRSGSRYFITEDPVNHGCKLVFDEADGEQFVGLEPQEQIVGMTYLGRASDLIGEALAWREAKAMLGDTSKETPHD